VYYCRILAVSRFGFETVRYDEIYTAGYMSETAEYTQLDTYVRIQLEAEAGRYSRGSVRHSGMQCAVCSVNLLQNGYRYRYIQGYSGKRDTKEIRYKDTQRGCGGEPKCPIVIVTSYY